MKRCFCISNSDNVATVLDEDVTTGAELTILGISRLKSIRTAECLGLGHKIALSPIAIGEPIIKYGVTIGIASKDISTGAWVHLHNCQSRVDQRSGTLDLHTGSSRDISYE